MLHITAHSVPNDFLFRTWTEAHALWLRLLVLGIPFALVLMPDHVHLVLRVFDAEAWRRAWFSYRTWRFQHRTLLGLNPRRGAILLPMDPPEEVPDRQHLQRVVRYVHLNPCRGRLVQDPLAWPFSTHRDRVGLAIPAVCPEDPDPMGFHAYVSADASTAVDGTRLPEPVQGTRGISVEGVRHAVSSLCRVPLDDLDRKGPPRQLAVGTLLALSDWKQVDVARAMGLSPSGVARHLQADPRQVARVARVLGDGRFTGLVDGDLASTAPWIRYRALAREKRFRLGGGGLATAG